MDLSKVGLRGIARDARAVLHGFAPVRVALDAESREQRDRVDRRLREGVRRAAAHGDDDAIGDHAKDGSSAATCSIMDFSSVKNSSSGRGWGSTMSVNPSAP